MGLSDSIEELRTELEICKGEIKSQADRIELLNQCDDSAIEVIAKMDGEIEALQTKNTRLLSILNHECPEKYPDNCEVCKGTNGGVRGNENIVDDVVMCDYCHASTIMDEED